MTLDLFNGPQTKTLIYLGTPISTLDLLANDFFEEAESSKEPHKAIPNYSIAWAFYRSCENYEKTEECDLKLLCCGVTELDDWHKIGSKLLYETLENSKKYMPSLRGEELRLPQDVF